MAFKSADFSDKSAPDGSIKESNSTRGVRVLGGRKLFSKKLPGSPGKLGKTSTKAESLSKLRGKGAIA